MNKTLITILFIISLILLSVITAGGYYIYHEIEDLKTNTSKNVVKTSNKKIKYESDNKYIGVIKEGEEIIVNLNSNKNRRSYFKLKINYELNNSGDESTFEKYIPIIEDTVLTVASSKTKEELMSLGGKEDLKEELKNNINKKLSNSIIKNIYFKTFVIQ